MLRTAAKKEALDTSQGFNRGYNSEWSYSAQPNASIKLPDWIGKAHTDPAPVIRTEDLLSTLLETYDDWRETHHLRVDEMLMKQGFFQFLKREHPQLLLDLYLMLSEEIL